MMTHLVPFQPGMEGKFVSYEEIEEREEYCFRCKGKFLSEISKIKRGNDMYHISCAKKEAYRFFTDMIK